MQPWLDFCLDVDIDPSAEQKYWPRLFKSHQVTKAFVPRVGFS